MKAKRVNEELPVGLWSDTNLKAIKGWSDKTRVNEKFSLTTKEPLNIILDDETDLAKLKFVFNKYRIKYESKKL